MKRFGMLLAFVVCAMLWLHAGVVSSAELPVIPMEAKAVAVPSVEAPSVDSPRGQLRRMPRSDRQLARQIRNDAAEAMGMSRLAFNRAILANDVDADAQLHLSLVESEGAPGFDQERMEEIIAMITKWIELIMTIFAMF